jgi:hypothetical protein
MLHAQTLDHDTRGRIHLDRRYRRQRGLLVERNLLSDLLLECMGSVRVLLMMPLAFGGGVAVERLQPDLTSTQMPKKMSIWINLLLIFGVATAASAVGSHGAWEADSGSRLKSASSPERVLFWPEIVLMKPGGARIYSCQIKPNSYFCY